MNGRPEQEIGLLFDVYLAEERVGRLLRLALAGTGLKPAGYAVTSLLATLGPTTPTEIARITGTAPSTLSGHLAELTARSLLRRVPAPVDGRSALLELTEEGEHSHRAAAAAVQRHMARLRGELRTPVGELRHALHDLSDALDRTVAAGSQDG